MAGPKSRYPAGVTEAHGTTPLRRHPRRLRVVVVVDGRTVPAAVARTIDRVAAVAVDLVGIRVEPPPRRRSLGLRLTALVDRVDRGCFRPGPDAFRPVDLGHLHSNLLVLGSQRASNPGIQRLDMVLDLTSSGVAPTLDRTARLGIWSLRYGMDSLPLGPAAFARDFMRGSEVSLTELVVHDDTPIRESTDTTRGTRVIYRSAGAMDRHSPARTRNAAAWKAAEFPARVLSAVAAGRGPEPAEVTLPLSPRVGPPAARSIVGLVGQVVARGLREAIRRIVERPGWFVAVRVGRPDHATNWPTDLRGFHPLVAPPGRFYADPFIVRSPTGAHLFVEDAPIGGGPARIAVLELDSTGRLQSAPCVALEARTHLSYPFVFQDGADWYMLPETAGTQTVELFRARRFPGDWEPFAVLLRDISASDPTLLHHDGLYWLFTTVAVSGASPSDELCLYWSESLTGPWQPHPRNPVVSDARRARPAGRILVNNGSLVRPAQDCTGGYGRRIVLNRIEVLSADEYRETPIGTIEPRWLAGVLRTHTYTVDDGMEALDGLRYERRLRFGRRAGPALR